MWPMLIMLAGSAIQAGGSAYGASQSIKQSKYQQDVLRYQADYEAAAAEINVAKLQQSVAQTKSAQKAATAASGFQSGDATEAMIDTDIQGEIDTAILRMSGGIEQLRLQNAGTMARAQGYGVAAGLYGQGGKSLLSGAMNYGTREGWFASSSSTGTKIPYIPAQ